LFFMLPGYRASAQPPDTAPKPREAQPGVDAKAIKAIQDDLAATKKELAALKAAAEAAKKAPEEPKVAAPEPKKTEEETKKAEEEAKKTADDITAAGDKGTEGQRRGDTAWMLTSSAFVMFMVPGLALFYCGMVRRKNVLATMMHSMAALAVVGVYWIAIGYALAFGPSAIKLDLLGVEKGGIIGWSWDLFFLQGVNTGDLLPAYNIPVYLHVMFQGMFAIITPALISGAIAERIRFWPFCLFMILWVTFVYCPLAHMVWAFDWFDPTVLAAKRGGAAIGLLGKMGALDFAGGTVVHIAAGMAGLACALVLRKRTGYPKQVAHPNSMVLTLLGAGLLWFGWFGFNGGSAVAGSAQAVSAFAATQAAAAAAGLGWMLVEWLHKGKPTALGLASGIVAGLVAVTPASGFVFMWGGVFIGLAAAVVCYVAVNLKSLLGYDDSLDAFGVHAVGGFVGAVLTGVFCSTAVYNAADGPFAYNYHRARYAELKPIGEGSEKKDSKLIAEAKAAVEAAAKDVEAAETKLKAASEAEKKDAETAVTDAKDVLADKEATLKSLETELETLTALVEKQDDTANGGKDKKSSMSQVFIQLKAAVFSVIFAFVLSLGLAIAVQAMTLGNFTTSAKEEAEGLDRTEHGEVGFDFGYATETVTVASATPRAAATPPSGNGRFDLAVEGAPAADLIHAWSALCQPSDKPADPDFLAVYPYLTTITGNRFRFRSGDPTALSKQMTALFSKHLGKPVTVTKVS
jgi:ammonium transporter